MLSLGLSAQIEFLDTQNTISAPFQMPIRISMGGKFYIFKSPDEIMLGPTVALAYSRKHAQYNLPQEIHGNDDLISQQKTQSPWIQITRQRYDGGLGLAAVVANGFNFGLLPFKGAKQVLVKMKNSKDERVALNYSIPRDLSTIKDWRIGDQGTYQTYGGVEAMVAGGVGFVNLARVTFGFQNQFIVSLKKISDAKVAFYITEENIKRSTSYLGPMVAKVSYEYYNGKRFESEFTLDIADAFHNELYQKGLKGKIIDLQTALNEKRQKVSWVGHNSSYFIGIPYVIARTEGQGTYQVNTDGEDSEVNVKFRENTGFLTTSGDHRRLVYRTDNGIFLFWSSEMKKAHGKVMEKYFFRLGRAFGAKPFMREMPRGKYGNVMTQLGMIFTRNEIEGMKNLEAITLEGELKLQCEILKEDCVRSKKRRSIMREHVAIMSQTWQQQSINFGKFLMLNPPLVRALIKLSGFKKELYFKFLNDTYQSVEGLASIEP